MNVKLCALVLALLLLAGCGASVSVEKTEPIDFYFCAAEETEQTIDFERPSGALLNVNFRFSVKFHTTDATSAIR